jgi:hypothetical protein
VKAHPYKSRPEAGTHIWLTPPEILSALGKFDLDPCAAPEPRPWPTARHHITLPDDGLVAPWKGRVWCNPPFGANTQHWLRRMALHNHGTALVFARTETRMFFDWVWPVASSVLFLKSRPKFYHADGSLAKGNSGGPIMLVSYGDPDGDRLNQARALGRFLWLR